jgi:hypothetical protein
MRKLPWDMSKTGEASSIMGLGPAPGPAALVYSIFSSDTQEAETAMT